MESDFVIVDLTTYQKLVEQIEASTKSARCRTMLNRKNIQKYF